MNRSDRTSIQVLLADLEYMNAGQWQPSDRACWIRVANALNQRVSPDRGDVRRLQYIRAGLIAKGHAFPPERRWTEVADLVAGPGCVVGAILSILGVVAAAILFL